MKATALSNRNSIVMHNRASLGSKVLWTTFPETVMHFVMQCLHGRIVLSSILAAVDMH